MKKQKIFTLLATSMLLVPMVSNGVNALEDLTQTEATPEVEETTQPKQESRVEDVIATLPNPVSTPALAKQDRGLIPSAIVQSGTWGTSNWTFDDQGVLTFGAGEIANKEDNPLRNGSIENRVIRKVIFLPTVTFRNGDEMAELFYGCKNMESIDLSGLDTTNVTDMSGLFFDCSNLTALDVSHLNTVNVRDMSNMFGGGAYELDLKNFNTSSVINMEAMFFGVEMSKLDLSNFDTRNVTNMSAMFEKAQLDELDCSAFDTRNVMNMPVMFEKAQLNELDCSTFDTTNVEDMRGMFYRSSVTSLNIYNFDMTNADLSYDFMFLSCPDLRYLTIGPKVRLAQAGLEEHEATSEYTEGWGNEIAENYYATSAQFMADYDGSSPGLYEWTKLREARIEVKNISPNVQKGATYKWQINDHAPAYYDENNKKVDMPFYAKLNGKIYDQNDTVELAEGTYEVEITNERPLSRAAAVTTTARIVITATTPTPDTGDGTNENNLENKILDITKDYDLDNDAQNNIAKEIEEKAKNGALSLEDIKQIIQKYAPNLSASALEELAGKLYKLLYPNSALLPSTNETKQIGLTLLGVGLVGLGIAVFMIRRKRH